MNLSIECCERDLKALEAAEQLTQSVNAEVERIKEMDATKLVGKAAKMLMTGNFSLETLGVSPTFFEQLEQLARLNNVTRQKYKECVLAQMEQLEDVEEAANE